ncbi:unnamed protein product, partial [Rhizoctonia solani]
FVLVPQKGHKDWYQIRNIELGQDIHLEPGVETVKLKTNGSAWYIQETSTAGVYEVKPWYGDNLLCRRGTPGDYVIRALPRGPSTHGKWKFLKVSNPGAIPKYPEGNGSTVRTYPYIAQPGTSYIIKNVATDTVIHYEPKTATGDKVFSRKADGSNNQKWLSKATGLGTNVTLQGPNNKHFIFINFEQGKTLEPSTTKSNGYFVGSAPKGYYIYPAERPDHVLDVMGGEKADGTEICLWPRNGEEHQMWYFEEVKP